MGSKICPLAWQNCSIMVALSRAARVTMWYGFFTAVGSFRFFCVWQPDSIESAPTAAYRPSTTTETPSEGWQVSVYDLQKQEWLDNGGRMEDTLKTAKV